MELCLGTVQQGMDYGINNHYGKPSLEVSLKIFHEAVKGGITVFDTARAYGDAELLLGEYFRNYGNKEKVKVISKLHPNILTNEKAVYDIIHHECEESLKRIGIEQLDGYLFHTPEYIRNERAVHSLIRLKEQGLVRNIGVSIYNIEDGDIAISTGAVDYIQLPFSVFDQRGINSGFIQRAKKAGIKIFTRSAFLQGLYFMDENHLPETVRQAEPLLKKLNAIINRCQLTKEEVLLQFVKMHEMIDFIVFGVDTVDQLKENISIFENQSVLERNMMNCIKTEFQKVSDSIIIPSLWSNGKKAE